jgi:hypothetical protein
MKKPLVAIVVLICLVLVWITGPAVMKWRKRAEQESTNVSEPGGERAIDLSQAYGKVPLSFEANQGQTEGQVKFLSRGHGYNLYLTSAEAVLILNAPPSPPRVAKAGPSPLSVPSATSVVDLPGPQSQIPNPQSAVVRMKLVGANPDPTVVGLDDLPGKANYFLGNDPSQWRTNVPTYAKVKHQNVYPGVDLIYYGNQQQLEYDFVVAPGADPNTIRLAFDGVEKLEVDAQGDVVLKTGCEQVHLHKPEVYQDINGNRVKVEGSFKVFDSSSVTGSEQSKVGFEVGEYDVTHPLVIDPVLVYSTYLGGSRDDVGSIIAVDATGNVYVTGYTNSVDFPTRDSLRPTFGGGPRDAFVMKLNASGSALIYSTYLGGRGDDLGFAVAVDAAGNAYVTGETNSGNFPTVSPLQSGNRGFFDVFVAKLNADGSMLVYSTYLGGLAIEEGFAIAVDAAGNAYVAGGTFSPDFPTRNAVQPAHGDGAFGDNFFDAFVAKLNPRGSALVYSTYLGGNRRDVAFAIAVDVFGNAYVTGATRSRNFPTMKPLQSDFAGDDGDPFGGDAFVAKLSPTGSQIVYSTYLGGAGDDVGISIAVDGGGNAYVTGLTDSTNFPTASPLQSSNRGFSEVFVAKLNVTGSALTYSTYLGGNGDDFGSGIAVDAAGNVHVTGYTTSTNFPTANPLQPTFGGGICPADSMGNLVSCFDAFVSKLNPAGSALIYSTYFGGNSHDLGSSIVVDGGGNAYVTGFTSSTNFPMASPLQPMLGGTFDAFIAKIADTSMPPADLVVRDLTVSSTNPAPGDAISVSFSIMNQGMAAAGAATHYVVLSKDATIDASDRFLADRGTPDLAAGNSFPIHVPVIIPADTVAGAQFIGVIADVENTVMESNEVNNTAAVMINVRASSAEGLLGSWSHLYAAGQRSGVGHDPWSGATSNSRRTTDNLKCRMILDWRRGNVSYWFDSVYCV